MTPFLTARAASISLLVFGALYTFKFAFGIFYIYRLLRAGPAGRLIKAPAYAVPSRPMSLADEGLIRDKIHGRRRVAMMMFWVTLLAVSILLYVLLDGFDLGVGMLLGLTSSETRRRAMLDAVAPIWDGNETWLVVTAVIRWGAFPVAYAFLLSEAGQDRGGVYEAGQTCCLTSSVRSPNVLISLLESDLWTFTTSPGLRSRTAFSASRSKENPAMNQCSSGAAPPSCGVTTFTIHPA